MSIRSSILKKDNQGRTIIDDGLLPEEQESMNRMLKCFAKSSTVRSRKASPIRKLKKQLVTA